MALPRYGRNPCVQWYVLPSAEPPVAATIRQASVMATGSAHDLRGNRPPCLSNARPSGLNNGHTSLFATALVLKVAGNAKMAVHRAMTRRVRGKLQCKPVGPGSAIDGIAQTVSAII